MKTFADSKDLFYQRYIAKVRPPREAQTPPMAIGSAFDAFAKSWIHTELFGKGRNQGSPFERRTIFEKQVESHLWDWAWQHGAYVFAVYSNSGALADLMLMLRSAIGEPNFEIELTGIITDPMDNTRKVPFLGKPDVWFTNAEGETIIIDWKVNGYCSNQPKSPMQGYVKLLEADGSQLKPHHKSCQPCPYKGVVINAANTLDAFDKDWARQTAIYSWLCGEKVGGTFITGIDQIVCNATRGGEYPDIRIAAHRCLISSEFQRAQFDLALEVWGAYKDPIAYFGADFCNSAELRSQAMYGLKTSTNQEDKSFLAACK